jgi:hypothetical protein
MQLNPAAAQDKELTRLLFLQLSSRHGHDLPQRVVAEFVVAGAERLR